MFCFERTKQQGHIGLPACETDVKRGQMLKTEVEVNAEVKVWGQMERKNIQLYVCHQSLSSYRTTNNTMSSLSLAITWSDRLQSAWSL